MAMEIDEVLEVLLSYGIEPGFDGVSLEAEAEGVLREVGEVDEAETVYSTSLKSVGRALVQDDRLEDPRLRQLLDEVSQVMRLSEPERRAQKGRLLERLSTPEPHCAWYSPIHYYGHDWGIYIRESCILDTAKQIALFLDPISTPAVPSPALIGQLLRAAFYSFYLHEQFHHKVESLGFRLLIATKMDRYRTYMRDVYSSTYLTPACLEESLANADAYLRLEEDRYKYRLDDVFQALRDYMGFSIPLQPPGYAEGVEYLDKQSFRRGQEELQSQVLEGSSSPVTPPQHWGIATHMIRSLMSIERRIFVVIPAGATPIFPPTWAPPGGTVSTRKLESALIHHYSYRRAIGGKGSHVKLERAGSPTFVLPGNRKTLSPGVVKQVLRAFGGLSLTQLPDVLEGRASLPS